MKTEDLRIAGRMGVDLATDLWRSVRFWGLIPVLVLFTLGAAWGLSDANVAGIDTSTPMDILYLTSALILLAGTLGIVVAGFDCISVPRTNGQLVMELAQPVPRWVLGLGRLIGVWITVALPTMLLCIGAILIVRLRTDGWVEMGDALVFLIATMLLLAWYTAIQLIASSLAKDGGSALALGIGT
ncbi:MAG TPA: ABC transporter permease subunit, partial [Candidatus Poseidoniales archaeon]|nr:ABC transporter permease subunit [Candidatus Poseidoniales archaeon]